jgi:Surface antigen variable number repeat
MGGRPPGLLLDPAIWYYLLQGRRPRMFHSLLLVAALLPSVEPAARVGQIFITGNEVMPDSIILHRLPLIPGQVLTFADLRVADRNLSCLQLLGIRSTVVVIDSEGKNQVDILVEVQESPITLLIFGLPKAILTRLGCL